MKEINYKLSLEETAKIFSTEVAKETDTDAWEKYTKSFKEIKEIEKLYIKKQGLFSEFDFETEIADYSDYRNGINYELSYQYRSQHIYLTVFSPKPLDEKQVRMMMLILFARKEKEIIKYSFIDNLKWVYNDKRQAKDEPEEYISIKQNAGKAKELQEFADYIYKNAKHEKINGVPFTCLQRGDYYYRISDFDGYIYRTYANDYKIKDIIRLIHSKDFEYKKDMSLTDIYSQVLNKGYNYAFDCEYDGKKFDVCANGKVYGKEKEELKEGCEAAEKILKEIYINYPDKLNFTVSKFWDELRNHKNIRALSGYADIIMKIKV